MSDIIILKQLSNISQEFVLSGSTHLGRQSNTYNSDGLHWAVAGREIPSEFSQLEVCVQICNANVSRNHAAILLEQDSKDFYLLDLNSLNGTYLNGKKLQKGERRKLGLGDRLDFAREAELQVIKIGDSDMQNSALFVGHPGGNLENVKNDLERLSDELSKRGFKDSISILYDKDATKTNVMERLEQAAYAVPSDAHYIFYYSGHGSEEGLMLGKRALTPKDLYSKLANIRGKKAVILDCCHAGIFLADKKIIPPQTLVLAASTADGVAYHGSIGRFTRSLIRHLMYDRGKFNLKDLREEIDREFAEKNCHTVHYQEPVFGDGTFTMGSCHSSLVMHLSDDK